MAEISLADHTHDGIAEVKDIASALSIKDGNIGIGAEADTFNKLNVTGDTKVSGKLTAANADISEKITAANVEVTSKITVSEGIEIKSADGKVHKLNIVASDDGKTYNLVLSTFDGETAVDKVLTMA